MDFCHFHPVFHFVLLLRMSNCFFIIIFQNVIQYFWTSEMELDFFFYPCLSGFVTVISRHYMTRLITPMVVYIMFTFEATRVSA